MQANVRPRGQAYGWDPSDRWLIADLLGPQKTAKKGRHIWRLSAVTVQ